VSSINSDVPAGDRTDRFAIAGEKQAFIPSETGNRDGVNRKVLRLRCSELPRVTLGSFEKIWKPLRR